MVFAARLMKTFTHLKFENSRCQPGAQTSGDRLINVDEHKEDVLSLSFRLCNLVLFGSPYERAEQLRAVWVDRMLNRLRWNKLVATWSSEWVNSTAFSGVMLTVDISFMAVPMTGLSEHCMRAIFLAISVSTICVVNSVVMSVLFRIQNQGRAELSDKIAAFINVMTQTSSGIAVLAVMYSLPYGLLIWGLISFGVALSFFVFPSISSVSRLMILLVWTVVVTGTVPNLVPRRLLRMGAGGVDSQSEMVHPPQTGVDGKKE
ncbi:hypothetical protein HYDPIDRAFT_29817 [Hydnomerulius pinastri MD-312]|uniref:Uncharacterized protein n=1 Tax=Hydnomerulius pinastri MD-312 TaxID=994086 RepID=A0A0C9W7G8_9AGAM|nr:hypothetical protein HYDPIDRAFT_29817 [Hydnomerulius pinastri MD-312]